MPLLLTPTTMQTTASKVSILSFDWALNFSKAVETCCRAATGTRSCTLHSTQATAAAPRTASKILALAKQKLSTSSISGTEPFLYISAMCLIKMLKIYLNIILNWFSFVKHITLRHRNRCIPSISNFWSSWVDSTVCPLDRISYCDKMSKSISMRKNAVHKGQRSSPFLSVEIMKNTLVYFFVSMITALVEKLQFIVSDFMTTKRSWIHNHTTWYGRW